MEMYCRRRQAKPRTSRRLILPKITLWNANIIYTKLLACTNFNTTRINVRRSMPRRDAPRHSAAPVPPSSWHIAKSGATFSLFGVLSHFIALRVLHHTFDEWRICILYPADDPSLLLAPFHHLKGALSRFGMFIRQYAGGTFIYTKQELLTMIAGLKFWMSFRIEFT